MQYQGNFKDCDPFVDWTQKGMCACRPITGRLWHTLDQPYTLVACWSVCCGACRAHCTDCYMTAHLSDKL